MNSTLIKSLHKYSLYDRLKSIEYETNIMIEFASLVPNFPVIPNERAGSWYVPPQVLAQSSVYFKSTDGHYGKWDINPKRLNLHLIDILVERGGALIVDITRQGKRFPDSQSKTIPIWCCVINRIAALCYPERLSSFDLNLNVSPSLISETEKDQILEKVDGFVEKLLKLDVDWRSITKNIERPIRPLFWHPAMRLFFAPNFNSSPYIPLICFCASDLEAQVTGFHYIQGAGDDEESWSQKLTPKIFWKNKERILSCKDYPIEELIHQEACIDLNLYNFVETRNIAIGSRRSGKPPMCWNVFDIILNLTIDEYDMLEYRMHVWDYEKLEEKPSNIDQKMYLYCPIPEGKKGNVKVYQSIPHILFALKEISWKGFRDRRKMLIHCNQGRDRSACITLCLMIVLDQLNENLDCLYPMSVSEIHDLLKSLDVSRELIESTVIKIQRARPESKISKANMKMVNRLFRSPSENLL